MRKGKPTYNDLLTSDTLKGTSLVRELEMAIERVVAFEPLYSIQFWKDAALYNLHEARTYLVNFVSEKVPDPSSEQIESMANFSSVFESVLNRL